MNQTWECGTPRSTCNAFAVLYEPRVKAKPHAKKKNRGPIRTKEQWAVISLETPAQRKERQTAERNAAMAKILRKNQYMEIGVSTVGAGNRAAQIRTSGVC